VLEVVREMIADLGYRVLHAADATTALVLIAGGEKIDLLFSDVMMPNGMSGIELAREARRRQPGLAVLITSGHLGGHANDGMRTGEFLSIGKPYSRVDLARCIREALGQ
jgi:CheY-like chemotaxis protein